VSPLYVLHHYIQKVFKAGTKYNLNQRKTKKCPWTNFKWSDNPNFGASDGNSGVENGGFGALGPGRNLLGSGKFLI